MRVKFQVAEWKSEIKYSKFHLDSSRLTRPNVLIPQDTYEIRWPVNSRRYILQRDFARRVAFARSEIFN